MPDAAIFDSATQPAEFVAAVDARAQRIETPCGDGTMVWRAWGEGPALVLLHGGHGAWSHWIRNVIPLSARFTVLVPDMPGYAESASPPDPYTADSLAEILCAGLDRILGELPFAVTGFSFGGVMGGHVGRQRPHRVARLVLVGSGGMGLPRARMGEMKNWRRAESEEDRLAAHRSNLGTLMLHDPKNIDALALYLQSKNTVRTRINSRAISLTDTLRRSLPEFGAPLAGIWGEYDATSLGHVDLREALLRDFDADAEFVRLDAGHWAQYEAAEEFNAALIRILETRRTARGK